ncbi:Hsp70 family protein [Mycobacterium sp. 050134]|uniref:Hsp70 family protein n=1 Tax=Mycobacterium sp. 050134 TaxID=3096111 RepID=UPI002ED8417B
MADGVTPALGLSIGATNLAVVTAENAVVRKPVLTLYRGRPPEIGVPSENPCLDEPGLVIPDFVDRVGDPAGIVAADGSVHRPEALIADGLRSLAYAATGDRPLPDSVAVTYPAHWDSRVVDALGAALSRVAEWSNRAKPLVLIPDAAAALFAARANPGLPSAGTPGTVAVCDFGGTGTSITLMDAAGDYRALAPTVRYHDFSGNLIDQALLTAVMGHLPGAGSFDPSNTLASGSLSRLRAECRGVKEQLSFGTLATLTDELPGMHGDFRLTRNELDEVIRDSLDNFLAVLEQTLARNGVRNLTAVVTVGGVANIPAVTTALSGRLRVPVVTRERPQLTPAVGAALRAARRPHEAGATMASRAAPSPAPAAPVQPEPTALAWPRRSEPRIRPAPTEETLARAVLPPDEPAPPDLEPTPEPESVPQKRHRFRRPPLVVVAVVLALLVAGVAMVFALRPGGAPPTAPSAPPKTTTSAPAAPAQAPPPSPATREAPPPSVTDTNPPAETETPTTAPPSATPHAEPPAVAAPAHQFPRTPAIPELPSIPGVNEPIPGLDKINQILQEFGVGPIGR